MSRYILNHTDTLHYDQYLAEGLPIGSGVIEGACRHLMKDRMDLPAVGPGRPPGTSAGRRCGGGPSIDWLQCKRAHIFPQEPSAYSNGLPPHDPISFGAF